ncbi:DUF614 FAMILY PROTEIN-RELATED [Salix viminalis]|uniref:DUF614 FAMILY PROTEIN-RELATED n=1 Tax=Salix viminalis TaxID=40686 RepID=A0A9Q0NMI6_SALVM|nr:DUF614 FAMILY PROTEIN-RELATED [Salix viminalis]
MGRPEADSSSSYDESFQPQEHQYEQTQGDFSAHAYETGYDDPSQSQYGDTTANNPQDQQQQPPPPPQQQQQQPPQANQGYGGQPAQPSQFPPQGPQTSPMYTNGPRRPAPYPPQGPQANPTQPAPYPPQGPQANPTQPAPYPPQGPQANPTQPAPYPPQGPQANPTQPAPYPPQGPAQFPPQSPIKPAVYPPQVPPQSPQMYNNGPNQPANFPPQGPQQMPQAFPPQAFQNPYQAQPQVGQFPPKSPVNGIPVNQQQQAWTTGIFDCLEDPSNALITALFPCVTFGQIAEIVDNGQSTCATNGMMYGLVASCIGMPCLLSCGYRSKLRAKELNNRGLDPSIGWLGNVSVQNMQQAQAGMAPPMNQRMMP